MGQCLSKRISEIDNLLKFYTFNAENTEQLDDTVYTNVMDGLESGSYAIDIKD